METTTSKLAIRAETSLVENGDVSEQIILTH